MLVLTIVALRLIGTWLIAAHAHGIVTFGLWALTQARSPTQAEVDTITMTAVLLASALPMLAGIVVIVFSAPLSRAVVPVRAHDLPTPTSVSPKTVLQIGIFLIGLWLLGTSLPFVISSGPIFSLETAPQYLATLVLGTLLMLGSGLLAGIVGRLRNWP